MIRDESMEVCDIRGMDCFNEHQHHSLEDYDFLYESDGVCKCLSACNSIDYEVQMIRKNILPIDTILEGMSLKFRYKESDYFTLIRYQEFRTKDFLSYVGGLLGLLAGISVLSIIEFFYFFSLRIFVNCFRNITRD